MFNILCVGAGGFAGAVLRYLIGKIPMGAEIFPVNTFLINIAGAFIIGLVCCMSHKFGGDTSGAVLFLKVGLCGGFTTFSTFSLEALRLIQNGHTGMFFLYAGLSVAICLLAAWLGETAGIKVFN